MKDLNENNPSVDIFETQHKLERKKGKESILF